MSGKEDTEWGDKGEWDGDWGDKDGGWEDIEGGAGDWDSFDDKSFGYSTIQELMTAYRHLTLEEVDVTTRDGHILTMHRIYDANIYRLPPVVIMHGGGMDSEGFLLGTYSSENDPWMI